MLFADIILPLALPKTLTYSLPPNMAATAGMRAAVPLRSRIYAGIILRIHQQQPSYISREILEIIDHHSIVTPDMLALWQWLAAYYMCSMGEVMKAAMPASLRLESQTKIALATPPTADNMPFDMETMLAEDNCMKFDGQTIVTDDAPTLKSHEKMLINMLHHRQSITLDEVQKTIPAKQLMSITKGLLAKGIIIMEEQLKDLYHPKMQHLIALNHAAIRCEDDVNALFDGKKRSALREKLLLAYLSLSIPLNYQKPKWVERSTLLKAADVKPSVLKNCIAKDIFVQIHQEETMPLPQDLMHSQMPVLSEAQRQALQQIRACFQQKSVCLLHGVTSSGKTEVYMHLIQDALHSGKQILLMVPEIALTTQLICRLTKVFGASVGVYHSKFSDNERARLYHALLKREKQILLGVRSSLFLPFPDLGLVIVDEEHEPTYKQSEPPPRYNARDAAIVRAMQCGAKVLLSSATPSIESYHNAQTQKYGYVQLTQRYGNAALPAIVMVNVSDLRQRKNPPLFSPLLVKAMHETLENNQQIILLQNRRGFSPYLECRDCGWVAGCEHCSVSLTYHKASGDLVCHYCGYSIRMPRQCLACGSMELTTRGFGTEKVEDELRIIFPDVSVARMDLDTTRTRAAMQRIIGDFEQGNTRILIGTQMVSKGLDFDNVALVGVLDADAMLCYPDFRSAERSFQMIAQVAGRAGRRGAMGRVLVQTRQPLHPLLEQVQRGAYHDMYMAQIVERRRFMYPPFARLIVVSLRHKDEHRVHAAARVVDGLLRGEMLRYVNGPIVPLVARVRGLFILNFVLKIPLGVPLPAIKESLSRCLVQALSMAEYRNVQAAVDVDGQ
jgi:primosomal protein N' (replication factor Y)